MTSWFQPKIEIPLFLATFVIVATLLRLFFNAALEQLFLVSFVLALVNSLSRFIAHKWVQKQQTSA
jgi:5-bromo-4-chloroindolyl phosphate hydrolysis protein